VRRSRVALAAVILIALTIGILAIPERRSRTRQVVPSGTTDPFVQERQQMVTSQLENRDITDPEVLRAMRLVPRHRFVPQDQVWQAYEDHPLPIGEGQTISQPYIVALMTQAAAITPGERVLEIGTGSGYQAAILAELTDEVYTVEIIETLGQQAAERLRELGYSRVHTRIGDGYFGWEEHTPYDVIIVTCASDHIPHPLVAQLAAGGRMVIPVGPPGAYQTLWLLEKSATGEVQTRNLGGVVFVPMTGGR